MSSVLWCVTNGRAAAPPAMGCITGVSTSTKPRAIEERADGRHRPGPHLEDAPAVGIHDQIEIALPVAGLDILQAVPLLGQRQVALGQEHHAARPDAQLAGAGPEQVPFDADVIAEIEQLEDLEVQFRQRVLANVDLHPLEAVGQPQEAGLAEVANRQDTAGGDRLDLVGLERLGGAIAMVRRQAGNRMRAVESPRVHVNAEGLKGLEVRPSLLYLIVE